METGLAKSRQTGLVNLLEGLPSGARAGLVRTSDIALATLAWPAAFWVRGDFDPAAVRVDRYDLLLVAVTAAIVLGLAGAHRSFWRHATTTDLLRLAGASALLAGLLTVLVFLIDRAADVPRAVPLLYLLLATAGLAGTRFAWMLLARRSPTSAGRASLPASRPLLLVGAGEGAVLAIQLLRHAAPAWQPVGILDSFATIGRAIDGVPILGRPEELLSVIARLSVRGLRPERILLTLPPAQMAPEVLRGLERRAWAERIAVDRLADIVQLRGYEPDAGELVDSAPADVRAMPRRKLVYLVAKRAIDTVAAAIGLIAGSVVILPAALAVALWIGPPPFFTQRRRGRGLVPFTLVKLKTMAEPVDAEGRERSEDERHHPLGRFLRRFKIDELPQLWNVLRGDMALVGPRPLLDAELRALPDRGRARAAMRPGLTGWAQVNGGQLLSLRHKEALDLWYIHHASLLLDLRILWLTAVMIVRGERINEGAIEQAMEAFAAQRTPAAGLRAEAAA